MRIKNIVWSLIVISGISFSDDTNLKPVEPQLEQMIYALLKREAVAHDVTVCDSGPHLNSIAAMSIQISSSGTTILLLVNQEKMNMLPADEQEAVILHEIGHIKRNLYRNIVYSLAPFGLNLLFIIGYFGTHFPQTWKEAGKNVLIALSGGWVIKYISQIGCAYLLRQEEFAADEYAFLAQKNPQAFYSVLEKRKKMFEANDSTFLEQLFDDHPSSDDRIARIKLLAKIKNEVV